MLFHLTPGVALSTEMPRHFLCELILAAGGAVQDGKEKRWSARKILDSQKQSQVCMSTAQPRSLIYSVNNGSKDTLNFLVHSRIYFMELKS